MPLPEMERDKNYQIKFNVHTVYFQMFFTHNSVIAISTRLPNFYLQQSIIMHLYISDLHVLS